MGIGHQAFGKGRGNGMSSGSNIEWTDSTWNPVVGCTKVSEGCRNCYAMVMAQRVAAAGDALVCTGVPQMSPKQWAYRNVVKRDGKDKPLPQWNNKVVCIEEALTEPLKWRKPRRVFVNSMSDLFHEDVPFEFIDKVFAVMALAPQHTFQVLTKRPGRMVEYFGIQPEGTTRPYHVLNQMYQVALESGSGTPVATLYNKMQRTYHEDGTRSGFWPLPNVWLGVSVEDQAAADARVPLLLQVPTAVRFLSVEPMLGSVTFRPKADDLRGMVTNMLRGVADKPAMLDGIGWVIVGGESGPGARACDVAWVRYVVQQCKEAGVPCFVKQLGARPYDGDVEFCRFMSYQEWVNKASSWLGGVNSAGKRYMTKTDAVCIDKKGRVCEIGGDFMRARDEDAFSVHCHEVIKLRDRKGGDMAEWPEDVRVREFPKGGV